ncbi:MAG: hypothetical protein KatS3mg102_0925 [Planctomycetota bacterium]|nr:MAG: hypothetical protein KatS3mg102_0925 [Planctomycetota bacterium]
MAGGIEGAGSGAVAAGSVPPLRLRADVLRHFAGTPRLRDPRGRTRRPALVRAVWQGRPALLVRGRFLWLERFGVERAAAVRFCEVTGDTNPIHREGDVLPGAYTAAKLLLALEVLLADAEIESFSIKFTAVGRYGSDLFSKVVLTPTPTGAHVQAVTSQGGVPIAEMEGEARRLAPGGSRPARVSRRQVHEAQLRAVRAFMRALGVHPAAYLGRRGFGGYTYPRAYLAALPSGEMVRQLRGQGGLLNKLTLRFEPGSRIPIVEPRAPAVTLEQPARRSQRAFQRILAAISHSVRTYATATALVLRGDAARSRLLAEPGA